MPTRFVIGLWALGVAVTLFSAQTPAAQSPWVCQAKPIEPCKKHHGRLSSQNGIGLKIWLLGTTRMVALENAFDDLPQILRQYLEMTGPNHSYIFGDFDICPVEPDTAGHLRRVCVTGGEKFVVQPDDTTKPAFRILSTWPARQRSIDGAPLW